MAVLEAVLLKADARTGAMPVGIAPGVLMCGHVFFDLDGTLFDTADDIRDAWRETLRQIGRPSPHFDERFSIGPSIAELVPILFPEEPDKRALEAAIRAHFGSVYDNCGFPQTVPYAEGLDLLNRFRDRGARLYVATNKRLVPTRLILRKYDLMDMFDGLYTSDMYLGAASAPFGLPTDRTLPKATILSAALRERGIAPADALMVGDMASDVAAGAANGMRTLAVTWGYGRAEDLAKACPDERL